MHVNKLILVEMCTKRNETLEKKWQNNCMSSQFLDVCNLSVNLFMFERYENEKPKSFPFDVFFSHRKFSCLHLFSSAQLFSINHWGFGNTRSPLKSQQEREKEKLKR